MSIDLRLALPVVIAWIIVGLLIGLPELLVGAAIGLWFVALSCIVAARLVAARLVAVRHVAVRHVAVRLPQSRRRSVLVVVSLAAASAALLVSMAAQQEPERRPAWLVAAAESGRSVTATAQTTQMVPTATKGELTKGELTQGELTQGEFTQDEAAQGAATFGGSTRGNSPVSVVLTSVTLAGETHVTRIPAAVFAPTASVEGAGIGTTIALAGTLAATDDGDDLAFLFFASGDLRETAGAPWYLDWANGLRESFRSATADLPGAGGDLLPGLSIGDTSAVSESLDSAMKSTSLSHLTAVSGANCAVVIGLIMLAGAALRISRTWRIAVSIVVLLGFVVLVTPEPSVLRAAVMATIVLATMLGGRAVRGVPTLALAVVILLALDPWLARSYGFILSVLATGGLLVLSGPLARVLARWLPDGLAAVIAIPLAAQFACQPVLILLNPTIPTFGVVANVLAGPAAPVATVLGLIACLLIPLIPPIGMLLAQLAWLPSTWIAGVATFFAALPGNSIPWAPGAFGVAASVAVVTLLLLASLRPHGRLREVASIALCLVLVGYLGVAAGNAARVQLTRPANWQIAACDVGQGDAVIVRSLDSVALIDTGEEASLLTACLDRLGIRHIDLLVLSHWDTDHVGGTSAIMGRVTRAIVGPADGSAAASISHQLAQAGAVVDQVHQGVAGGLGELRWQVLWPRQRLGEVEPGNDASVVIRFDGAGECVRGCLSSVFLGDLGRVPQARVMGANRLRPVDVVKVAHHGSADQSEGLYRRLRAAVGIVSVGADNDYGHPTSSLLRVLAGVGTVSTRTDREGMVLLSPLPDGGVEIFTEKMLPSGALRHR